MTGQFVDISHFNPTSIDWQAYKSWSASLDGVSRVSMRSSYGTGFVDDHFQTFRLGALAAGIDSIIYYHYAYPSLNSAVDEANYQFSVVGAIRPQDVIMLDYEEAVPQANAQWALDFLVQQERNYGGKLPTIYASSSYVQQRLQDSRLARYPLTLANWTYDPNARPPCPPPWTSYVYLQYSDRATIPGILGTVDADVYVGAHVILNSKGMVADIAQSYQLFENEMDLCGPWSVASLLFSGPPNKGPRGTSEDIDQWTDSAVGDMGYSNPADFPGVSIPNEEWLLTRAKNQLSGFHYQEINPDIERITLAVKAGYPVIITAYEPNIYAWDFGSNSWVHAYPWNVQANHVLPVGGIDQNGNFIMADQLNNAFQGYWPPIYKVPDINPSYAVVVALPWLAPIPNGDPKTWPAGFNAQIGGSLMPIPSGWKDDGTTLTAPNGIPVRFGFRSHIINAQSWDSKDMPLQPEEARNPIEESNPALGSGSRQITNLHVLEYTPAMGVFEGYVGQELMFVLKDRDTKAAALSTAQAQIAQLQAQIAAGSGGGPTNLADIKSKLDQLAAGMAASSQALAAVESELSSDLPK